MRSLSKDREQIQVTLDRLNIRLFRRSYWRYNLGEENSLPIVALFATANMTDFLQNALTGLANCGVKAHRIIVGCPINHYDHISIVAQPFNVKVEIIRSSTDVHLFNSYVEFRSEGFNEVCWLKICLVRQLLGRYDRVIYSDLDVAWLRDPSEYLQTALDFYPMAFQSEAQAVFPPAVCAGFMAFRRSDQALTFLDAMLCEDDHQRKRGLRDSDQPVAQRLLESNLSWLRATFVLPETLFPNGLFLAFLENQQRGLGGENEIHPFIFHANWMVGSEAKRNALDSLGAWTVPNGFVPTHKTTPILTVLFPMHDLRFDAAEAVRAWTLGQSAEPQKYRVVVVAGPESASMIPVVRSQLRPIDALIELPTSGNEVNYWLAGAQTTSSPWLLHVEGHSRPSQDCLEEILKWIVKHPESEALNCTIENSPSHKVSPLARSWFSDLHSKWAEVETWPRLHRTAFAIRRDIISNTTLLQAKYRMFAPALLSARLHAAGRRIITLSTARVQHLDSMMGQHRIDTADYVYGELQAFVDEPVHFMTTYFGWHPESRLRLLDNKRARIQTASALRSAGRGNVRNLPARLTALAVLGYRSLASSAKFTFVRRGRFKLIGWVIEKIPLPHRIRLQLFVRDHRRIVATEQLSWYQFHGRSNGALKVVAKSFSIEELEPGLLIGVHNIERHNEVIFCWSEPLFLVRLQMTQGTWIVRLNLANIRSSIRSQHVFAIFGGRPVDYVGVGQDGLELTITIKAEDDQHLMVCVPPLRERGRHARWLGLPLSAISIWPVTLSAGNLSAQTSSSP